MGDEELYIVTAVDGTPMTTIDVFNNEGYEIEFTPDGSTCRLSQVHDNSSCFEEAQLGEDEPVSALISERCKGREIVTLKPVDCEAHSKPLADASNREKRFFRWCLRLIYRVSCFLRCCFRYTCSVHAAWVWSWC
ncbi:uncharacterized protein LOC127864830 [Dreissena polymorpha]|uniref:uncharacterized protein LOC127864830 n=1 Tax=Dreissena polymorpha TaxID=45954 RepID=UPI00226558C4|nr:uncharacterized protein LOC127864830 [Dreissena polymorpha]